ncbi:MAG: cysteine desulfurase [Flammeovirgaceae bacterium]|nr:cysteine desulfurase [Flammeovirgaceae bacterium]MDW8286543.1 cysteine desulfurase family protein [Flammeovirgaceae bacterium]
MQVSINKNIYLDNAATTPLNSAVLAAMTHYLKDSHLGNPSSTHAHGREAKAAIEQARKTIAEIIRAKPSEIIFTSGGTESNNLFIRGLISMHDIKHIISSRLEHHAVLHTIEDIVQKNNRITVHWVEHKANGELDMAHLEHLLKTYPHSLVSIMHANNEIGNINPIEQIASLCQEYKCFFHTDTVQTIGCFPFDMQTLKVHALVGSAHKFHGPKGVGFLFLRKESKIHPLITGGMQERGVRSGTENVPGIVGLAKALEIAYESQIANRKHLLSLKSLMIRLLKEHFGDKISFNGLSGDLEKSMPTILNVSTPESPINDMLLFRLDLLGVSASGGSACSSGAQAGSHVLKALSVNMQRGAVRFSFSHLNTENDIRFAVEKLVEIYTEAGVLN